MEREMMEVFLNHLLGQLILKETSGYLCELHVCLCTRGRRKKPLKMLNHPYRSCHEWIKET